MPGYIPKALKQFGHEPPPKLQDQPYPYAPPNHGVKTQYVKATDNSPPLSKGDKTFVMKITGTFLFYARAINSTILPGLSAIASEQNPPTENTMKWVKQFLYCASSQEEAISTFNVSGMVLAIHSNYYYLSENNARSRAGGHHFISNDEENPPNNVAVLNLSTIINNVISSV